MAKELIQHSELRKKVMRFLGKKLSMHATTFRVTEHADGSVILSVDFAYVDLDSSEEVASNG